MPRGESAKQVAIQFTMGAALGTALVLGSTVATAGERTVSVGTGYMGGHIA